MDAELRDHVSRQIYGRTFSNRELSQIRTQAEARAGGCRVPGICSECIISELKRGLPNERFSGTCQRVAAETYRMIPGRTVYATAFVNGMLSRYELPPSEREQLKKLLLEAYEAGAWDGRVT